MIEWEEVSAIASTISAITSVVVIPFVAIQLRSNNQIAKAQLINELERDLSLHAEVILALSFGGKWYRNSTNISDVDRMAILKYVSFFERVYVIVNTNVLSLQDIDDIFAGRFFYLVNNPCAQEIMNDGAIEPYLASIRNLSAKWSAYRRDRNLPIPLDRSC
jgi:hypothetical protein